MVGQSIAADGYRPSADLLPEAETLARLRHIREVIGGTADAMPVRVDHLRRIGCDLAPLRRAS